VDILIEPINPLGMPGYFLNRQDEAHRIAAQICKPNLKVQMDLFHCAAVEKDVVTELRKYLDHNNPISVGHIQIAGVPDRHEPDTGVLDFDPLFHLIDQYKFAGWIGLEYIPVAGTSAGLGWLRQRADNSLRSPN
jgi:2-dehydrotetronate isomerase